MSDLRGSCQALACSPAILVGYCTASLDRCYTVSSSLVAKPTQPASWEFWRKESTLLQNRAVKTFDFVSRSHDRGASTVLRRGHRILLWGCEDASGWHCCLETHPLHWCAKSFWSHLCWSHRPDQESRYSKSCALPQKIQNKMRNTFQARIWTPDFSAVAGGLKKFLFERGFKRKLYYLENGFNFTNVSMPSTRSQTSSLIFWAFDQSLRFETLLMPQSWGTRTSQLFEGKCLSSIEKHSMFKSLASCRHLPSSTG